MTRHPRRVQMLPFARARPGNSRAIGATPLLHPSPTSPQPWQLAPPPAPVAPRAAAPHAPGPAHTTCGDDVPSPCALRPPPPSKPRIGPGTAREAPGAPRAARCYAAELRSWNGSSASAAPAPAAAAPRSRWPRRPRWRWRPPGRLLPAHDHRARQSWGSAAGSSPACCPPAPHQVPYSPPLGQRPFDSHRQESCPRGQSRSPCHPVRHIAAAATLFAAARGSEAEPLWARPLAGPRFQVPELRLAPSLRGSANQE
mmetsp:Transcript_77069/g.139101  ORF Transcript_77069/g.139101 Transcript_77069/m.139101 type:complete len:256 (-) Transcript_77069:76-843(-)